MGVSAAILAGASTVATIGSTYSQYKGIKAQGDYEQGVYSRNEGMSKLMAEDAIFRGKKAEKSQRETIRQTIGSQRAALAAQNVDLESGSALDVQQDTAALGAEDVLAIRNNAWREAWGYRVQASEYAAGREYARISTNMASKNTILTGGLQIANTWANYANASGAKVPKKTGRE
jgi:hypothetical protein